MSEASNAQLITAALASVEDRIQQRIEAARQRRERERQQRAELAAARNAGIGRRNAARLRHQASRGDTPTTPPAPTPPPEGGDRSNTSCAQARAGGAESEGARS